MSCAGIIDVMVRETGRYMPGEVFTRAWGKSPWMSFIRRGVHPGGLSQTINVLTVERNAPDVTSPAWNNVTVVDGQEGGACLPVADVIQLGSTTRSFQLQERDIRGPDFCAEEMRTVFALRQQLEGFTQAISQRVILEWEAKDRYEYSKLCDTKVVVNDCFNPSTTTGASGSTDYPAAQATQTLGLGLLQQFAFKLLRDGAADSALLTQGGTPVLTVIASPETIGNLQRQNSDLRQDIRWADSGKGNEARLLRMLGINNTYGGFMFVGDIYARRFSYAAGVYTEIPPFVRAAASKGWKWIINTTWQTAQYEEVFIFDPDVFTQLVPDPITNPAPGYQFNPVSYVGDIRFLNIPDRTCNPLGQIGFHYIRMGASSMPKSVWKGVGFIVKRCDPACGNATSCTS